MTPDGTQVIYKEGTVLSRLDVRTRNSQNIEWLTTGKSLGEGLSVLAADFDLSPDGKHILFTANVNTAKETGTVICVAALDGTDCRRLSPNATDRLPRYLLNGYSMVEKAYLPASLLEALQFISPIDWPFVLPEEGAWNRKGDGLPHGH